MAFLSKIFKIELDQPLHSSFTANDIVSGKVVLQNREDQHIGRVTIEFSGRCKTKIVKRSSNGNGGTTTHTYRGRADFFHYRAQLFVGNWTVRPDRYEWGFQFQFPAFAGETSNSGDWAARARAPYEHLPGHALPPTFSWSSGSQEAFIEYKLEAKLERPAEHQSIFGNALEEAIPLLYVQPRLTEIPHAIPYKANQNIQIRSLQLEEGRHGTELSFREQCRSFFKSDKLPLASWNLQIDATRTAHLDEPLVISLRLKRLEGTNFTSPTIPDVTLRNADIVFKGITDYRTIPSSSIFGSEHNKHDETDVCHQFRVVNTAFSKQNDFTINISTEPLSYRLLQPSFRTYGIVRTYRLKFKALASCVDKTVTIERKFDITVLPPKPAATGVPTCVHIGASRVEEPLPQYETAVASADMSAPVQDVPSRVLIDGVF